MWCHKLPTSWHNFGKNWMPDWKIQITFLTPFPLHTFRMMRVDAWEDLKIAILLLSFDIMFIQEAAVHHQPSNASDNIHHGSTWRLWTTRPFIAATPHQFIATRPVTQAQSEKKTVLVLRVAGAKPRTPRYCVLCFCGFFLLLIGLCCLDWLLT